jgi:hypothetical protein
MPSWEDSRGWTEEEGEKVESGSNSAPVASMARSMEGGSEGCVNRDAACRLLSVVCCLSEVVVAGRPDVDLRLDLGLGRSLGRSSTWIGWWCLEGKEATEQQDDDVFNAVRVVLRASMQRPRLAFLAQNSGVMHTPKKDPDALLFLPRCGLLLLSVQVGPIAVRLVSL